MRSFKRDLRSSRTQRGTGTIEIAIVLSLVLILTLGVLDFALGARAYNSLTYAAREGARYAVVRSNQSRGPATAAKIADRVRSQVVLLNEAEVSVSAEWIPSNSRNAVVKVSLSYPYKPITRLLPLKAITLTSSSQSVIAE